MEFSPMIQPAPTPSQPASRRMKSFAALRMPPGSPIPSMSHIAKVALDHLRVPFAVVTLFEEERPFVVGRSGGGGAAVDGTEGLSLHVIDSDDVVVFEDLETSERYRPLAPTVDGRPVRFFAAAPMALPNGTRIGTICILDHQPRALNIGQRIVLRQLATVATDALMTLAGCRSAA